MSLTKIDTIVIIGMLRDSGLSNGEIAEFRTPNTLRDDFAKAVISGIASNPESGCNSPGDLAHYAYRVADAMMKERLKNA